MKHELTFREDDDPKGYMDGLDDVYDCACGDTFQANGDVGEAFEHGVMAGREAMRAEQLVTINREIKEAPQGQGRERRQRDLLRDIEIWLKRWKPDATA